MRGLADAASNVEHAHVGLDATCGEHCFRNGRPRDLEFSPPLVPPVSDLPVALSHLGFMIAREGSVSIIIRLNSLSIRAHDDFALLANQFVAITVFRHRGRRT